MSLKDREFFLETLKETSTENFRKLVLEQNRNSNKGRFDLKEVVSSLSSSAIDDVWNILQELCTQHLLIALCDENEDRDEGSRKSHVEIQESRDVLRSIAEVGKETVNSNVVPVGLIQTGVVLNGVLLNFPEDCAKLKQSIGQLCLLWLELKLEGCEALGCQTFLYFTHKSLKEKSSSKNDIKQVWLLKDYLKELIVQGNDSQTTLDDLLLSCVQNDNYLNSPPGVKFLACLLATSELTDKIHASIKDNLTHCSKRAASIYGQIYLKAWQENENQSKQKVADCIQDLMHHAIHGDRSYRKAVAFNLLSSLGGIHREKKNANISKLLYELYEPILWRALKVANGYVRCNASAIFFDVFPLENPEMNNEESDVIFQRQLQLVENLLDDDCAIVRTTSIYGTFSILYKHWELLPATSIKSFIRKVSDLALDGSVVECRLAVFKGFMKLFENPLSHPLLRVLLPKLQTGFHDPSEKVRIAFADMLLMVKNLKSIKFWSIVPPEHLLARLATDSIPIGRRIVSLIFNSYFPIAKSDSVKLERTISLIETNKLASRRFFQLMPKHADVETIVHFMLLICKALKVYVRQRMSEHNQDDVSMDGSSANDSTQDKENINNANRLNLPDYHDSSFSFNNPELVSGLLDACTILWKDIYSALYQRQNSSLLKVVHRSFSSSVPLFFMFFKDCAVNDSLVYLSSLLPVKAVPMVSGNCLSRLRNLSEDHNIGQPQSYATLLESMCNWGKASMVLDLVCEWIQEGLTDKADDSLNHHKNPSKKKKGVAFSNPITHQPMLGVEYISFMLCHPVCNRNLLQDNHHQLMEILQVLRTVLDITEKHLMNCPVRPSPSLIHQSFLLLVKLEQLLNEEDSAENVDKLIVFWHRVIYPCLNRPEDSEKMKGFTERRELAIKMSHTVLSLCCNITMIGAANADNLLNFLTFGSQLLGSDVGEKFLAQFAGLMLEVTNYSLKNSFEPDGSLKGIPHATSQFIKVYAKSVENCSEIIQESEKFSATFVQLLKVMKTDADAMEIYREVIANFMTAMIAELTADIEKGNFSEPLDKFIEFPGLSSWIATICCANDKFIRHFIDELKSCIEAGAVKGSSSILATTFIVHTLMTESSGKLNLNEMGDLLSLLQNNPDPSLEEEEDDEDDRIISNKIKEVIENLQEKFFNKLKEE